MIGIYKIITKNNNKIYIGSSDNIDKRINCHLSRLKRNVHHSPYLQNVYNKYGKFNLEISVVEILENNITKIKREQFWMDKYKSYDRKYGYNVSKKASCNITGEKITYQYSLEGIFIKKWKSRKEIKDVLFIDISATINQKNRNISGGFQWKNYKKSKIKSVLTLYCAYNTEGKFIKNFQSIVEIKEFFKMKSFPNICRAINQNKTCTNHYWRIYDNYGFDKTIEIPVIKTCAKKVLQLDLDRNIIKIHDSLTLAAKSLELQVSNLHRAVGNNLKYKTCRGFIWEYL